MFKQKKNYNYVCIVIFTKCQYFSLKSSILNDGTHTAIQVVLAV